MSCNTSTSNRQKPYALIENAISGEQIRDLDVEVERWSKGKKRGTDTEEVEKEDSLGRRAIDIARGPITECVKELMREATEHARVWWEQSPLEIMAEGCVALQPESPTDWLPYVPHRDGEEGLAAVVDLGQWTGGRLRIGSEAEDRRFDEIPGATEKGYAGREHLPEGHKVKVREGSIVVFDPQRVHGVERVTSGTRIAIHFSVEPGGRKQGGGGG